MVFQPGQSGNPKGRLKGSRPKPTVKRKLLSAFGDCKGDPLIFLTSIVKADGLDLSYRLQAAGLLAPYRYARVTKRMISTPIDLPPPTTIEQANANIAKLTAMAAASKLGLDEASDLVGHLKSYIEAKVGADSEARLAAIEAMLRSHTLAPTVDVEVVGGLPIMAGCEQVLMPPRKLSVAKPDKSGNGKPEP